MSDIVPCNWGCTAEHMVTIWFQMKEWLWEELLYQPSATSGVDPRAVGDLWYKLDYVGLCKPAIRSWNRPSDWQGASVVWSVLVWYGWIYAAWGPPEQHSSEFAEYDSIVYLGCHTTGYSNNWFWTSRRLGLGFWQHLLFDTFGVCWCWINWTRQICRWSSQKLLNLKHCQI